MQFSNWTTASSEMVAIIVDIILIISNIASAHKKSVKVVLYIWSLIFMLVATLLNFHWNIGSYFIGQETLGKVTMAGTYIFSYIGTAFIGYYLIAVIDSRKPTTRFFAYTILTVSIIGIIFVIWGTLNNQVFDYQNNIVCNGPMFKYALYLIILLGFCDVVTIVCNIKTLGLRDSVITLAYFLLPVLAVNTKVANDDDDFVFAAVAISELIVNNMLLTREKVELAMENELTRKSAQNKSDFLANMSHEIRTPINAVLGLNEMILRESKEPDILGYANDISSSGRQLLSLVNDVLDFSKIESGKMELVPVSYDLSSLLNDVVNMTTVKTDEKKLDFYIDIDENIPSKLYGDEVRLKQIITNILSNAVKYTKEGHVKLSVQYKLEGNDMILRVAVSDTGIGMKAEDIEQLFVPFQRLDEKNNRNIQGTGLGMAITKRYLELMGSSLEVKSTYGVGSTFSFDVKQKVEAWDPIGDYQHAFEELRAKTKEYKATINAPMAKILIVDDMEMNLKVAKGLLKETHIQVDTALSGMEALDKMGTTKYHIVFLDHMMPKMSGIEVIQRMRQDKDNLNCAVPSIALTANAVSGSREKYLEAGFDDYLTKPIDTEKLEAMLRKYLPLELQLSTETANKTEIYSSEKEAERTKPEEIKAEQKETEEPIVEENNYIQALRKIEDLDVDKGIETSYEADIYLMVVDEYNKGLDDVIEAMNKHLADVNAYEYTVQVHALKNMARQAGAMGLGDEAYELELAGKEENWDKIKANNSKLIEDAVHLKALLSEAMTGYVQPED